MSPIQCDRYHRPAIVPALVDDPVGCDATATLARCSPRRCLPWRCLHYPPRRWTGRPCIRPNSALVSAVRSAARRVRFSWPSVLIGSTGAACLTTPDSTRATLVGWETAGDGAGGHARVLVGPARFRTATVPARRPHHSRTLWGIIGRIDISAMPIRHVGYLAWLQGATAPPLRGDRYIWVTGGFGLRLQQ